MCRAAAGGVVLLVELLSNLISAMELGVFRIGLVELLLNFVVVVTTSQSTNSAPKHVPP